MQTQPTQYNDLLAHEQSCPFCAEGSHNTCAIITNDFASLSLAQAPYTTDHLLIAPLRHVTALSELSNDEKDASWKLIDIGTKLLYTLGHQGVSVMLRDGDAVGKSEAHLHIHLVPDIVLSTSTATTSRAVLEQSTFIQRTAEMKPLL